MNKTGIKGTIDFIVHAIKGDNKLEKVEAISLIDNCFTWIIIGTISAPIIQSMYDIAFISYAIATALTGASSLAANALWSKNHAQLYTCRKMLIISYFIAMPILALLPILIFNTASLYLVTAAFMMFIITLYMNMIKYPSKFIYSDPTLRIAHDNRISILNDLSTLIVGASTIIYAGMMPADYILRASAFFAIIFEIIDIAITWKWLKLVDELDIITDVSIENDDDPKDGVDSNIV